MGSSEEEKTENLGQNIHLYQSTEQTNQIIAYIQQHHLSVSKIVRLVYLRLRISKVNHYIIINIGLFVVNDFLYGGCIPSQSLT